MHGNHGLVAAAAVWDTGAPGEQGTMGRDDAGPHGRQPHKDVLWGQGQGYGGGGAGLGDLSGGRVGQHIGSSTAVVREDLWGVGCGRQVVLAGGVALGRHPHVNPAQVQLTLRTMALVQIAQQGARVEQDIVIHLGNIRRLLTETPDPAEHGEGLQSQVGVAVQEQTLDNVSVTLGLFLKPLGEYWVIGLAHHEESHDPQTPYQGLAPPGVPDGLSCLLVMGCADDHGDEEGLCALADKWAGHQEVIVGGALHGAVGMPYPRPYGRLTPT